MKKLLFINAKNVAPDTRPSVTDRELHCVKEDHDAICGKVSKLRKRLESLKRRRGEREKRLLDLEEERKEDEEVVTTAKAVTVVLTSAGQSQDTLRRERMSIIHEESDQTERAEAAQRR